MLLLIFLPVDIEDGKLNRSVFIGQPGGPDTQKPDRLPVPEPAEKPKRSRIKGSGGVGRRIQRHLMGGGGKISVFDFHGNTSGQLLSGAKPFCHTLRKTAEHRGGIPFRQDILGESSGISHTLGPGRKRLHRPVVDTVGVLPEKPSVALELGDEKVHVRVCLFPYRVDAQLI